MVLNKRSPACQLLEIYTQKWSHFDTMCVINCQVMILYLNLVITITLKVETLMLNFVSLPYEIYF